MQHKTYFNWSTGKDSALALYMLQQDNNLKVDHLLTTVNAQYNRVTMHGLSRAMLLKQVEAIGYPLSTIELPEQPSMQTYNDLMQKGVNRLKKEGYTHCGFGDIFLEDLRAYREQQLKGIQCHFPLWQQNTTSLMHQFISLGFKAVVLCLNSALLDPSFLGRELDAAFLKDLPDTVDPCGENGEFHTFCYDGPIFAHPVSFQLGEAVYKEYQLKDGDKSTAAGYWFVDILEASEKELQAGL